MAGVNANYNMMVADGGGYVSSARSAGSAGSSAAVGSAGESSGPSDASNISSFSSVGTDFDMEGDMNALYEQKAQAEGELGELKGQRDEAQGKINERRQELTEKRTTTEAGQESNKQLEAVQTAYNEKVQAKNTAQQELTSLGTQCSAKDQQINSNAQQQQSVSSSISAAQSQLSSLKAAQSSGGSKQAEGSSDAQASGSQGVDNSGAIAALEARISELNAELNRLKAEAQNLQNEKVQLERQQGTKQNEVSQLDMEIQVIQQQLNEAQQARADEDPKLQSDFENDGQLQDLQGQLDDLEGQITAKEAALSQLESQIAEAEAKNSALQSARLEDAEGDFQSAASNMDFDVEDAETTAQSIAARDVFGKRYSELTDEEKDSLETRVAGEVTLAAMESAREILKNDPDNAAAQAVIEQGAKYLDAQELSARSNLYGSLDNMPAGLQDGATAAMEAARQNAPAGTDPEVAAMEALSAYLEENVNPEDYSEEELAALDDITGAAGQYIDSRECSADGVEVLNEAAEAMANSDLLTMKAQLAAEKGVDVDKIIVLSAGDGNDDIQISNGPDGGLCVWVGNELHEFTAEEAQYLLIDGGKGNDTIYADYDVTQDLHIFGGAGNDTIHGGSGNDFIGGGDGNDKIYGWDGNDTILGGKGDDTVDGGWGDDMVLGGDGKDKISGGYGNDILDGGAGDDTIKGGAGNDTITGGDGDDDIDGGDGHDKIAGGLGNDKIYGGRGNDYVDGGEGNDYIDGQGGDDFILGGLGNDKIFGQGGNDIISGGDGDDEINGGDGDDFVLGDAGNDTIHGGAGEDTLSGGIGDDSIYGGSGNDTISGGDGDDFVDGEMGDDKIWGNAGNDWLQGGSGSDTIYGNSGIDSIYGETGSDYLYGDAKDEEINGGSIFVKDYISKNADVANEEFSLDDMDLEALIGLKDERAKTGEGTANSSGMDAASWASALELGVNYDEALKKYGGKVHIPADKIEQLSKWCGAASIAGGILGVVSGISDFAEGDVMSGIGNTACGVSALTSGTAFKVSERLAGIYSGHKILGTISDVSGVVGGAVTTFTGIADAFHAFENGDGWSKVSSGFEIAAGGTAVAAGIYSLAAGVACPPLLIVSAICMGVYLGVDYFNPNK
ncbi:MAG: hypothetical protein Q4F00_12345 [bacterium]|nr:hypothetical protein [bacterium]